MSPDFPKHCWQFRKDRSIVPAGRWVEAALGASVVRVSSSGDGLNHDIGTVPGGKLMGGHKTLAHVWGKMAGFASLGRCTKQ